MRITRLRPLVVCCLLISLPAQGYSADRAAAPATAKAIEAAIHGPLLMRADEAPLRPLLGELGNSRSLSILLDRRVDPEQPVTWRVSGDPFLAALQERMSPLNCAVSVVGETVFAGPASSAGKLRTLIAIRRDDFQKTRWPAAKRSEVLRDRSMEWDDATEPAELLAQIGERWGLIIEGADGLPYDLWKGGKAASVNAVEALSLVLIQFDKTFSWGERAGTVVIVPVPEVVEVERRFRLPKTGSDAILAQIAALQPPPRTTVNGQELIARGTAEDLDAVAAIVSPPKGPAALQGVIPRNVPLSQRQFTLTARQVTVREALKKIEESGIGVDYDPEALRAAGIDLRHRIDLELKGASFDDLMKAICEPVGLRYEVEALGVTLSPK